MNQLTSTFYKLADSLILVAALGASLAADSPLAGVWQLDSGPFAQPGLYMFTPAQYSMVLAAANRRHVADTNKATADELRAIWGPLLAYLLEPTTSQAICSPFAPRSLNPLPYKVHSCGMRREKSDSTFVAHPLGAE